MADTTLTKDKQHGVSSPRCLRPQGAGAEFRRRPAVPRLGSYRHAILRPDALVAAWQRGDIDAAYVWAPAKSRLLASGGAVYRTYDKLEAAGYVIADLVVARTAFLQAYPEAVVAILKANNRALDLWTSSPDQAAAIIGKQAGVSAEVAKADLLQYDFVAPKVQLEPQWPGAPGKAGRFAEVLQGTAKFLVEQKSIRSVPDLAVFQQGINPAPLAQALA